MTDLDETWNISFLLKCAGAAVVYFLIAPSGGVVYLVTETPNWMSAAQKWTDWNETLKLSIFQQGAQREVVYFLITPSGGVVYLVTETPNWMPAKLASPNPPP